jgi:hypothetical protein
MILFYTISNLNASAAARFDIEPFQIAVAHQPDIFAVLLLQIFDNFFDVPYANRRFFCSMK